MTGYTPIGLQLLQGTWGEPTDEEKLFRTLAIEYHEWTETYDQTVCSRRSQYDGCAIPANAVEHRLITQNAQGVFRILVQRHRPGGRDRVFESKLREWIQKVTHEEAMSEVREHARRIHEGTD